MEIDPFGFIEDSSRIPEVQESILREFPFPRKDGVGGGRGEEEEEEEEESQELRCCFPLTESTGIVMMSLPETEDGAEEEGEGRVVGGSNSREEEEVEEYHTPPENSLAVLSSDEAAGVGAESAVDLARDDDVDVLQDVLALGKGGEEDKLIVLERKLEKIQALRRKDGSPASLRSKLRIALGLSGSCVDLDGGKVPDLGGDSELWILECGQASKGKNVLDECLQEYLAKKLKNVEKKLGIISGNEHSDASDTDLMEVDREVREIRILKGDDASGWSRRDCLSRRLKSPEKARGENVSGASSGESDGILKRTTVDGELGGSLVDNSGKRLKSLESSGSRGIVKDVAYGNSEAVDLGDGLNESPVKRMKVLEVNMHVETPSDSVRIVKEKIRELLKSMEKLNPQEGSAEGSSMRRKLNKNSDCEDAIRIIDLEVLERHDGLVVDRDVENAASSGEAYASKKRSKNLARKTIEEIEKFRYTAKSFHPRNKGTRKCPDEGSGMITREVDEFELCDNLARKISMSRKGFTGGHADVLGESCKDAQGLRKLPPSIEGQSTDKESRKDYQSQASPPRVDNPPPQADGVFGVVPSKSDVPPPPKVKVPDLLKVMRMIADAACIDADDGTECSLDVAKRFGMNIPRPRWWPERNFELG